MSASPDVLVGSFAAENRSVFRARFTLTDGGSEFQGQFARLIRESPVIEQWLTYPKCPKMNAHIKRFNRTVQEDCIDHAEDLLFADTEAFNDRLWNRFVFVGECSAKCLSSMTRLGSVNECQPRHPCRVVRR